MCDSPLPAFLQRGRTVDLLLEQRSALAAQQTPYRLSVPTSYLPAVPLPLVVHLHGEGEGENSWAGGLFHSHGLSSDSLWWRLVDTMTVAVMPRGMERALPHRQVRLGRLVSTSPSRPTQTFRIATLRVVTARTNVGAPQPPTVGTESAAPEAAGFGCTPLQCPLDACPYLVSGAPLARTPCSR